jgi:hypothetical protein
MLANILGGRVGVYSPATVRARNPSRLSSMYVPEVLIDGFTAGHNQGEGGHGQIPTMRPLSFVAWHCKPIATPVARSNSIDSQNSTSDRYIKIVVLSFHVTSRSADANSMPANLTSKNWLDSQDMPGVFLTSEAVCMRYVRDLRSLGS